MYSRKAVIKVVAARFIIVAIAVIVVKLIIKGVLGW